MQIVAHLLSTRPPRERPCTRLQFGLFATVDEVGGIDLLRCGAAAEDRGGRSGRSVQVENRGTECTTSIMRGVLPSAVASSLIISPPATLNLGSALEESTDGTGCPPTPANDGRGRALDTELLGATPANSSPAVVPAESASAVAPAFCLRRVFHDKEREIFDIFESFRRPNCAARGGLPT